MDNNLSIEDQMRAILSARDGVVSAPVFNRGLESEEMAFDNSKHPDLGESEFIIPLKCNEEYTATCVRELTWSEALDIDAQCHISGYFSGELERRLILNKSIQWVFEATTEKLLMNKDSQILKKLSQPFVEELYKQYLQKTSFTSNEASVLYNASIKYFKNEAQDTVVVPPLVIIVDMMSQGVMSYSEKELMSMSNSKMEKIKLILSARSEVLNLNTKVKPEVEQSSIKPPPNPSFIGGNYVK